MRLRVVSLFCFVLGLGLVGCTSPPGTLQVSAVDSTFRRVADRHDAYVRADTTLTPLDKSVELRDTALLRTALDRAGGVAPPTTLPLATH